MIRKIILFYFCFTSSAYMGAQIKAYEYTSGTLSEETIKQILEKSKKSGVADWELEKANTLLQQRLMQQNTINTSASQKTISPPLQVMSGCTNPGFENGTTNGWVFKSGDNTGSNLPCSTCLNNTSGIINEVVTSNSTATVNTGTCSSGNTINCSTQPCVNGIDTYGGFPVVAPAPLGGNYSLLMNNSYSGDKMQKAQYTFVVNASSTSFTYQYALVLQSGGHPANAQPYFAVDVMNVTKDSIFPCAQYNVNPPTSGNLAGWSTSTVDPTVYYKTWTTVILDLSSIIGDTISLDFTVSDCNAGAHFGYAYIDANCNPNQINVSSALCTGGSTLLQGIPGMASYNWNGPQTGTSQNLVTNLPGTYTLTTASGTSCPSSNFYYNLNQIPGVLPSVSLQVAQNPICFGVADILTASGATTYIWLPGGQAGSTFNVIQTPTVNTIYTYSVLGTDISTSCASVATNTVLVKGNTLQVAGSDTICKGNSILITASGASSYTWSPATGLSSINSASVTANPTVTTIYTINGNSNGCATTATTTVHVLQISTITPTVVGIPVTCYGAHNGIAYVSNPTTGSTYAWSPVAGNSDSIIGLGPGIYTLAINNSFCPITTITKTVSVTSSTSALTQTTTYTNSTCSSGNGKISILATGGTSPYTYQINGATYLSANTYTALGAGTYSINVKDHNGCIASSTVTITQGTINNPIITATSSTVCAGTTATLTAGGANTYTWSTGATGANYTVTPTTSMHYTVTGTDINNCKGSATSTVNVVALPNVVVNSANICLGSIASLTANGANTYSWSPAIGLSTTTGNSVFANLTSSTIYYVIGTNINGCKQISTSTVTINPLPVASFSANPSTALIQNPIINFTDLSSGASTNTWNWFFGDGGSSNQQNTTHTYNNVGIYPVTLIITSTAGCKDSIAHTIEIDAGSVVIHNAFSPNNDGLNELFIIDNITDFPSNHVYIYNRWGQLVWHAEHYNNTSVAWNGTSEDGTALYAGTYYYTVEIVGKKNVKGWVELTK